MTNALEKLKEFTVVVADTADFEVLKNYGSQDSTTNPSLVFQAASNPKYKHLVDNAIEYVKSKQGLSPKEKLSLAIDKLFVNFGVEILKIVPGRVSTEVDARLSYDIEGNVKKARELIALYKEAGIEKERVLIKLASTWEGIQAAKILEEEGIHCNLTLLFSLVQAAACAEAKVTLISPFVGRITDFYKQKQNVSGFEASKDPGVISVQTIFAYYKKYGYKTSVMGASFRNKEQTTELAGCDLLTISPNLLEELKNTDSSVVVKKLDANNLPSNIPEKFVPDQKTFLYELNDNEMAYFKTGEGIRKFAEDLIKLEKQIEPLLN
ncbi:transaldolase [Dictyostelium purpureum]|uniref:Transaldolase n=1 Tax=Dictyostelium purpureum TaxID=5786 RepID=F0ZEY9_DICPU|nr:transaldolase [Dictyostelium purpureum]EGC37513.1 transaldolase [Dictyostelium purpureum]|eukprot:XP_003285987.1 transaldolase [Dictyostelium purpureum]